MEIYQEISFGVLVSHMTSANLLIILQISSASRWSLAWGSRLHPSCFHRCRRLKVSSRVTGEGLNPSLCLRSVMLLGFDSEREEAELLMWKPLTTEVGPYLKCSAVSTILNVGRLWIPNDNTDIQLVLSDTTIEDSRCLFLADAAHKTPTAPAVSFQNLP